jgi:AcrR family transcriptional regulator
MPTTRTTDRRVQKTEALLRNALAELVREKPYDDIVVKEILHRANVGRSTFYTHFSDKDELLRSCIEEILRPAHGVAREAGNARSPERLLWFSLPVLVHVERHRDGGDTVTGVREGRGLHEHLRHAIAELIESDVRAALRGSRRSEMYPAADLLVAWIASTFVMVLEWWLERAPALPAREVDRLFRALVEPSLAAAIE